MLLFPPRVARQVYFAFKLRLTGRVGALHLGCGQRRIGGFVNIDLNHGRAVDYVCSITRLPCRSNSVERIESYHVFEHLRQGSVAGALQEWFRVLRPGGSMVMELPDFDADIREYMAGNLERLFSIFGRDRFPGDIHYFGYNFGRVAALLSDAGFVRVREEAPQDYHAQFEPCLRVVCEKP
jgi:predicted SAM-dependent methyltransferase